ncbi:hypothetical protein J5X84_20025 [Streptosporangiaceae bacterium NEAU-GS5]|nr:hypothetical protein [Streptosporangiaceae bacterium NEAU-GS5]
MTWLGDVLADLADGAPQADLAERTIGLHQRRRRIAWSLAVVATAGAVAVTLVGVTAGVRDMVMYHPAAPGSVVDLPARGVGPLSYAYQTYCAPSEGVAPRDCRSGEWRLVTRGGTTYHLPQALRGLDAYIGEGLLASPLAITRDGGKIAYYSSDAGTFQVRDLASGQVTTAPSRVPQQWLGSIAHLLLSDDGRFLAFTKNPALTDPAMLIDMRERMVRPLPNGWNPIGLSPDGDVITLAQYAPKARLKTLTRLWTTSTAGNGTTVDFTRHYLFSPLSPDGRTIVTLENRSTDADPCRSSLMARADPVTGRPRATIAASSVLLRGDALSLRSWLNDDELLVLVDAGATCRTRRAPDVDEPADTSPPRDPPYRTITGYALNVHTGATRIYASYQAQGLFDLVLPGPGGAI